MPCTVIHHQALDQSRIRIHLVLHLHYFDHVQINRISPAFAILLRADGENSVDDIGGEFLGESGMEFCGEGRVGDIDEVCSVEGWRLLERLEKLHEQNDEPQSDR